jgi:arsenate reductase (glutaredoxin)
MSETKIYHNPNCTKSRLTLAGLEERGIDATVIRYLEAPPDTGQLRQIIDRLDVPAITLVRTADAAFEASGLDATAMDDDAIVAFLIEHPSALQRPVVIHGDQARIGRPPELAFALFDDEPS